MAVGNRSSGCRGYFTSPWIDGSPGDSVARDSWIFLKEDEHVQALESKKSVGRETALRGLIGAFNRKPMAEFVAERGQALVRALAGILEREDATSTELTLACRALGLLVLAMAEDISLGLPSLIKEISPLLQHRAQGEDCRPACAALEAVAILAVAGMHTGDLDIEAEDILLLDWLWSISQHTQADAAVAAAALVSWTVLITTLAPHRIAHHRQMRGPRLVSLARSEEPSQPERSAAGHALAVLAECAPPDASELEAAPSSAGLPEASKPDATQYMLPQGGKVLIRTWFHTVQFTFLQEFLGAGLPRHMQHNRLLHHIFEFVPKKRVQEASASPSQDFKQPAALRKTRSACRRANELTERAQTLLRNTGRARKEYYLCIQDE